MKLLYVSSDSYYNCPSKVFNADESPDNLVYFHYCFAQMVKMNCGSIDVFPRNKDDIHDCIIFNEFPLPGTPQSKFLERCISRGKSKLILYLMETPVVRMDYRRVYEKRILSVFDTVYTWNEDICDGNKIRKFNFTSNIKQSFEIGIRPGTLTCIAANKKIKHPNGCYYFRRDGIRALADSDLPFDLYGHDWDKLKVRSGIIGSALNRLLRIGPRVSGVKFAWKGSVREKSSVLSKYNFNLVIENATNYNGYITEKILHSLAFGSIPIYYGSRSAMQIFKESVLYLEDFQNWDQLVDFLLQISNEQVIKMQNSISILLASNELKRFDARSEAERIYSEIRGLL